MNSKFSNILFSICVIMLLSAVTGVFYMMLLQIKEMLESINIFY